MPRRRARIKPWGWALIAALVLGGYWLLPISGRVVIETGAPRIETWPQWTLDAPASHSSGPATLRITDVQPWTHVAVRANGRTIVPLEWGQSAPSRWTWTWPCTACTAMRLTSCWPHWTTPTAY